VVKKYISAALQQEFIFAVVGNALNLERGILHTMVWLFRKPGKVLSDYLAGKTKSYLNPLNYMLIIAGVYAFLALSFNIFDNTIESTNQLLGNDQKDIPAEALAFQQSWLATVKKYMNLIPLLIVPFASIFSRWYYRKKKLYYGEHLILNTYVFAQSILITTLLLPVVILASELISVFPLITTFFTAAYFTYAYHSYFGKSVVNAFFGAVVMYLGGFVVLMTLMMIVVIIWLIIMATMGINPFATAG